MGPGQAQSAPTRGSPGREAIRLWCWTKKQDMQVNSSARFGITALVRSSPDRSAPGSSMLSPVSL